MLEEEIAFKRALDHSRRVKEDKLLNLNLGTCENPKMVRVSTPSDDEFKGYLHQLLMNFKNVFAWSYEQMKGVINPKFYQHGIILKEYARPTNKGIE